MRLSPIAFALIVVSMTSAARAAAIDLATKGSWIGVYGADGYILNSFDAGGIGTYNPVASTANDRAALPAYITSYSYNSAQQYVWDADSDSDPRGVQDPASPADRRSATSFNIGNWSMDFVLNQPKNFLMSVYFFDQDFFTSGTNGRDVTADVNGADFTTINNGAADGSFAADNNYQNGAWVNFSLSLPAGTFTLHIVQNNALASNATISAVAFDALPVPEPASLSLLALASLALVRRRA
jgi:hypothetical protein